MDINHQAKKLALQHFEVEHRIERVQEIEGMFLVTFEDYVAGGSWIDISTMLLDDDFNVVGCESVTIDNPKEVANKLRLRIITGEIDTVDNDYADFDDYVKYYELMLKGNHI